MAFCLWFCFCFFQIRVSFLTWFTVLPSGTVVAAQLKGQYFVIWVVVGVKKGRELLWPIPV